ncbi:Uncharacterised protein [Enterococcus casseliflavus]|nr:hypothetical protein ECA02_33740 [Enterococcus casseliflavus]STP33384.1 Uncharacterised protein [Enterococcus casseliflavus]
MENKRSYYKILSLAAEEGWLDYPEIVKEVQKIDATILDS